MPYYTVPAKLLPSERRLGKDGEGLIRHSVRYYQINNHEMSNKPWHCRRAYQCYLIITEVCVGQLTFRSIMDEV